MRAFLLALVLLLSSCGFHLRGVAALPFDTLYIPNTGGFSVDVKRLIRAGTRTTVVDDPKAAQAQLVLSGETRQRNILSLSGAGRVRELQLVYSVNIQVIDGKGGEFLPTTHLSVTRDLSYNDTDVLSKEAEEANIYREMQADLEQQILRRVSAAKPAKPAVQ